MGVPRTAVRTGHCYRDSFGAVWRVVGFDSRGVICVLYHRDVCGALVERPHTETWDNFLADIEGEVACPAA
ncbi:MAG: hypothetical protein LCH95_00315 [Proteobacteria bacterium]|nr:hypothetical protein [Pseudomonadota bacterium]